MSSFKCVINDFCSESSTHIKEAKEVIIIFFAGHALGMFHEQSRPDRDSYVTIKYENIIECE